MGGYSFPDSICLLTLQINANTLIPGRDANQLHGFLNNISLIDFVDQSSYPVGSLKAKVERNLHTGNRLLY